MSDHRHGPDGRRLAPGRPPRGVRWPRNHGARGPAQRRPAQPFWAPRAADVQAVRADWDWVAAR